MQRDVFLIISQLGVSLESFHKPLGDGGGCPDVFRLRKESSVKYIWMSV